jgi:Flp pilus assembly protein TadG
MKAMRVESRRERGSYFVEAAIAFPFLLGVVFLMVDIGWTLFVKATLQHAVREGVRYAVTGQVKGGLGQTASIQDIVQQNAAGLLASHPDTIHVRFFRPDTQQASASNAGGNVVIVSVDGYLISPLLPFMHEGGPISVTVRSGDKLEASGPAGPPPL